MSRFRRNITRPSAANPEVPGSISGAFLQQARKTGQLNLSNKDFKQVPEQVWKLNEQPNNGDANFSVADSERWWDQVELTKLILASNSLEVLSERISVFPALAILDLHDNKLCKLPDAVCSLQVLEKLDASHNQLKSLSQGLFALERMVTLFIQHNQITDLPEELGNLINLRVLDACNNRLQSLPFGWSRMVALQKINLSDNQLQVLPDDICTLPLLSYLDLSNNKLSQLPKDWAQLSSLKELYLRRNSLSAIPDLSGCTNLKELYFARNGLTALKVDHLPPSLIIVEFRDNKIKVVHEDIAEMKDLQRLDLANNDISTLPPKMGLMEHMKALNLEGNPMRGIRRDIVGKGTLSIINYLRTRIVDGGAEGMAQNKQTGESSLPVSSEVAERTKMHAISSSKSLNLSGKMWSADLLDGCSELPIQDLNMSNMALGKLPDEICQFQPSLRSLNLTLNKLTMVGPVLGGFTSLTHLNLSGNLLTTLPPELCNLQKLVEINIMQNRFVCVPECIYSLDSLEHLLASGNGIGKIDADGLRKLPKLATLSLQNNNIAQVPPELCLISSLRNLQLEGNTFKIPRQNVLQQGSLAVLEYLKGRVPNK